MPKKREKMINLTIARIKKGMSQYELAEKVGVYKQVISGYECGQHFPRVEMLKKLAQALDCEIKDII